MLKKGISKLSLGMVFVMLLTYALPNITMATSMDTYLEESQAEILRSVKEQ